jgi:hypothetical protein
MGGGMADLDRFLRDVRDHKMTIELDQGLHRCIRFGRTRAASAYHFRLVTWPGHLSISGDMGDYTFSRLHDMFTFFRFAGPEYDKTDRINVGYWDEKLTSVCKSGGREELDEEAYTDAVRRCLNSHINGMSLSDAKRVMRDVRWDNLLEAPSSVREAQDRIYAWRCPVTGNCPFAEFWNYRITKASYHLVWCLRAIQWGIKQYDLVKEGRTQADHDRRVLAGEV